MSTLGIAPAPALDGPAARASVSSAPEEPGILRDLWRAYATAPWLAIVGGWLGYDFVLSYTKDLLDRAIIGFPLPFLGAALSSAVDVSTFALITPAAWWVARRAPLGSRRWPAALAVNLLAAAVLVTVLLALRWLYIVQVAPHPYPFGRFAVERMVPAFWHYVILVTLGHGVLYARMAHERALQAARLEGDISLARLRALQSQIEPHFLYNTLNSIAELVHEDVAAARRMAVRLGELFEAALRSPGAQEVPLAEELAFVEAYGDIQRTRFCDRLTVRFSVPDGVRGALVPRFVLQPLVENAIRHGIAPRAAAGTVQVSAVHVDGVLRLEVRDDGVGPGGGGAFREGVGLANTRARLQGLYGDAAALHLHADRGGTLARIDLPFRTA